MPGAAAVAVGDVVECEKFPNAWYTAQVKQTRTTDNKVLVHYEGWSTRWDEWVDPSKLATGGGQTLGQVPKGKAPKGKSTGPPSSGRPTSAREARAAGVYDSEEVRALKQEVVGLREANASLEERLTALELDGRKGGLNVPPAALFASLQLLATAEAELGQDAEVQRNLKSQGMSKTVKKKPGLNSAELMVEACLRFATCMRAQAVENSKAQVALIDTQLQMAREQKAVRMELVQMQQLMMKGFNTASGLAATAADAAGPEEPVVAAKARSRPAVTPATPSSGMVSPKSVASTSSVPEESATKIQAAFRGKKERQGIDQAIEDGLAVLEASAVEIQRHWRGNKERDEIEAQFEAEVAALREVEEQAQGDSGAAPATTSVEQAGEEDEEDELAGMTEDELVQQITEEQSAIKMQAAWRGFKAREDYYDFLDATVAAEQVQAAWRGHRVRQAVTDGNFDFLGLGELLEDPGDDDGLYMEEGAEAEAPLEQSQPPARA